MYYLENAVPKQGFYVYILYDGNLPFYIGKGRRKRYTHHFQKHQSNKHKQNRIQKILNEGRKVRISIVLTGTEDQCFQEECRLILTIGRADLGTGPLLNLTAGGEGLGGERNPMFGHQHTLEVRRLISEKRRARTTQFHHSTEHRNKLRQHNPGGLATSKPIYQIDASTGMIIKEWPSAKQAAQSLTASFRSCLTNITRTANTKHHETVKGFYWRWIGCPSIETNQLQNIEALNNKRLKPNSAKSVAQLDDSYTNIQIWESSTQAAKHFNCSNSTIGKAIQFNRKSCGFYWRFV